MKRARTPLRFCRPMECLKVDRIPEGELWQYELKLDGYRCIAIKEHGDAQLFSRNGNSFNAKFPSLLAAVKRLRVKRYILDGEIVALDEQGRHSFELLQNVNTSKAPLRFYIFDSLHSNNENLMEHALRDRRKRLEREFTDLHDTLQLSPILSGQAHHVLTHVKEFEFEGVIAKRLDSIYAPGKESDMWQKLKTQKSDDFLVGGYIRGRYGVEQLVVGEKRDGDFYFIDSVKNGFVSATRQRVFKVLQGKETERCPFANLPEKKGTYKMDREKMKKVRWVQPRMIAEIAFNERTQSGHLRHSKFLRLRDPAELHRKARTTP
jgi:DNA ligase D-like protein (predicted ligase)